MNLELTEEELKFLLEMIQVLRFTGSDVEKVYEIKKKIQNARDTTQKENKKNLNKISE